VASGCGPGLADPVNPSITDFSGVAMANESPAAENPAPHESAEQATTHGTVAHGGKEGADFPPFDAENFAPQLVWLAIIFGVLYVLLARIALPRVGSILSDREARIANDLDASRQLQVKAQAAAAENDEKMRATRAQAQAIGREAQQKAAAETAAQRAASEQEFAAKLAAADAQISSAKAKALGNVEQIAIDAAAAIVEKLTESRADRAGLEAAYRSLKS
jgi:F-type H+-transporting ATPase subunit b